VAKWVINQSEIHPYTIRKPVFVIDEKLANDFNLKRKREYNTGIVSTCIYLNQIKIPNLTKYEKEKRLQSIKTNF